MRHLIFANLFAVAAAVSVTTNIEAADYEQIGQKIDNAKIMDRVVLVGVIAGGSATKDGVAVIKDNITGRTYAIKTGDNLPGVNHIQLKSVRRELAVFNVEGKEYQVRLSIGGYAQEAEDDEDLAADLNKDEGPGLFEKWYGSKIVAGTDVVRNAGDEISHSDKLGEKNSNEPVVIEMNNTASSDEAVNLRKDKDGPVVEFLDKLTHTTRSHNKSKGDSVSARNENSDAPRNSNPTEESRNAKVK
jgi:hypothetical protein